ncbi:MAG: septum formation protein [Planctomycetota bacterium]
MTKPAPRILLASGSDRRRDLLREAGIDFEIVVSNVDEEHEAGLEPEEVAPMLALRKAREVARRFGSEDVLVIGADTMVAVDGAAGCELLGKPVGEADAHRMLLALSESKHRVVTGVAVIATRPGGGSASERSAWERTWVQMRPITLDERNAYVESGEWRGKAGGYAIQENADTFVTELSEGGFDNVVGLPVALTLQLLADHGFPAKPEASD